MKFEYELTKEQEEALSDFVKAHNKKSAVETTKRAQLERLISKFLKSVVDRKFDLEEKQILRGLRNLPAEERKRRLGVLRG